MIEYLNIFIQVVEQGSFSKVADALQIHRPTVSKAIPGSSARCAT
ncbi:LysR family transcriptional regulator [Salmonella enterica]